MNHRIVRLLVATVVVGLLAMTSGCGDEDAAKETDYPEGSVILKQNIPQSHGDFRLVAVNIDTDGGTVIVELPEGGNEKLAVKKGDTAQTSDGALSLEVVDIQPPGDDSGAPGQGSGVIVVVPTP